MRIFTAVIMAIALLCSAADADAKGTRRGTTAKKTTAAYTSLPSFIKACRHEIDCEWNGMGFPGLYDTKRYYKPAGFDGKINGLIAIDGDIENPSFLLEEVKTDRDNWKFNLVDPATMQRVYEVTGESMHVGQMMGRPVYINYDEGTVKKISPTAPHGNGERYWMSISLL